MPRSWVCGTWSPATASTCVLHANTRASTAGALPCPLRRPRGVHAAAVAPELAVDAVHPCLHALSDVGAVHPTWPFVRHSGKYAPLEPRLKIPQARSQALAAAPATSPISVRAPTSSAAAEPRSPEELQRGVLDKWLRHSKLHAARQAFSGWKQAVPAGNQAPAQPTDPAAPTASPALRRWADMSRRLQAYVKDRPYYGTGIYGYQTRSSLERDGIAVPGGEHTPERWARMSRKVLHEARARHARVLRFHRTRAHDAGGVPSDPDSDEAEDQAALGRNDVASFMQRRRRRQQRDALRALAAARRQGAAPTAAHRTGADRLNSFVTRRALRAKQGAFAALASQAARRRQAALSY